jgi:hypothetical protein
MLLTGCAFSIPTLRPVNSTEPAATATATTFAPPSPARPSQSLATPPATPSAVPTSAPNIWARVQAELDRSAGFAFSSDELVAIWDGRAPSQLAIGAFSKSFTGQFNRSFAICPACSDTLSLHGVEQSAVQWIVLAWTPARSDVPAAEIEQVAAAYLVFVQSVADIEADEASPLNAAFGLPGRLVLADRAADETQVVSGVAFHLVETATTLYLFATR